MDQVDDPAILRYHVLDGQFWPDQHRCLVAHIVAHPADGKQVAITAQQLRPERNQQISDPHEQVGVQFGIVVLEQAEVFVAPLQFRSIGCRTSRNRDCSHALAKAWAKSARGMP